MRDLGLVLACALVNLRDEEDYSFVVVDPLLFNIFEKYFCTYE
jgi:hypothetical protein